MPEQEYYNDRDFYLDIDFFIFVYRFQANCIILTSVSCIPHLLIWRLRKGPLLILAQILDLCPALVSHFTPEAFKMLSLDESSFLRDLECSPLWYVNTKSSKI